VLLGGVDPFFEYMGRVPEKDLLLSEPKAKLLKLQIELFPRMK
jgi:hypothetical protein